jgi:hypothetical protein
MIKTVFETSGSAQKFIGLSYDGKCDTVSGAPCVTDILMEIIRAGHADPAARNVFLSPNRADQTLIWQADAWVVYPLPQTLRDMGSGVRRGLSELMPTEGFRGLPPAIQDSVGVIPTIVDSEFEYFMSQLRTPLSAHLVAIRPPNYRG